jgi:hypothetical protein
MIPSTKPCVKCGQVCDNEVVGKTVYCAKHYRFHNMRDGCRMRGVSKPSYEELEALAQRDFADGLCSICRRPLKWRTRNFRDLVTLQHDRSGKLRLICLVCNQHHKTFPGDSYFDTPHLRWCRLCNTAQPPENFSSIGRCRTCTRLRMRAQRSLKPRKTIRRLGTLFYNRQRRKWTAQAITLFGKRVFIGEFRTREEGEAALGRHYAS